VAKRIIIDTDIGDDIDDSLAIALALSSPELEVAGITTVFRNVGLRAQMAQALAKAFGKPDIPVFKGCGAPIGSKADLDEIPGLWAPEDELGFSPDPRHGVDFILGSLEESPETVIVSIGPMTNIAAACEKRPGLMERAEVLAMAGAYDCAFPEWNIACDPEAADIALRTIKGIKLFGLELTTKCALDGDGLRKTALRQDPAGVLLNRMLSSYTMTGRPVILHDLCPICALLRPESFDMRPSSVEIELKGELTRGVAVVPPNYSSFHMEGKKANAFIASAMDPGIVARLFLERAAKAAEPGNAAWSKEEK
jgi:inosine-uridine nucleoside N-ribohydrolase